MKKALENSRYMVLLAVAASLVASLATFRWGIYTTFKVLVHVIETRGNESGVAVEMLELMDKFLIAVGLYELFIRDDLELPHWLEVHNLHDIKVRLSSIAVR